MKKMKVIFGFFLCLSLAPQTGFASASGNAQISQLLNIATAGAAGVYSAQNFSQCGWRSYSACVRGLMGALQMIQSIQGAMKAGQVGADLYNGDYGAFTFDPVESGFCFDVSTGCTQTALDHQLSEFETAFQTGDGYNEALGKLKSQAVKTIADIESKGFSIDTENGVITDPNGKKTTFAAAAASLPKNFGVEAQSKLAGVIEKIQEGDKSRGLASAKGVDGLGSASGSGSAAAGGGLAFQKEYYDGLNGDKYGKGKKGAKKKHSLLAGLADEDAKKGGVGVAGDDIFAMVNRRYIKKTKSSEFFKK